MSEIRRVRRLMRQAMPLVLVISSYVAASRVGGGIAPYVLGPMKVDPVHIPTCLFGRHPGWGPPGGGPVAADTMARYKKQEGRDVYFLANSSDTGFETAVRLRGDRDVERWDPHTGEISACPHTRATDAGEPVTVVPLRFAPVHSVFLVTKQ